MMAIKMPDPVCRPSHGSMTVVYAAVVEQLGADI
jgi:hypothetical protein